jgi:hypothetical protein
MPMQLLSYQDFAGAANETFDLAMGEAAMPLTLVEVKPLTPRAFPGLMRDPFALLFRSASQLILPQRLYRLRSGTMGALEIFLVPIARDPRGVLYEAVFN